MVFRKITEFIDNLTGSDSFETEQSMGARLVGLITFPFRFIFHFIAFLLTYWASSRSVPAFVRALPAIFFGGSFVGALIVAHFLLETRLVGQYEGRYQYELTKVDDPEMAANYADKLMGLLPENDRYRYQLGFAKYQAGDLLGAVDVMKYIAEEKDDAQAQVWLAKTIAADKKIEVDEGMRNLTSIKYFESAVRSLDQEEEPIAYTEAHLGLAEAYQRESVNAENINVREKMLDKAIGSLREVLKGRIMFMRQLQAIPLLIKFYQDKGEVGEAQSYLRLAMDKVGPIARQNPDNIGIWAVLVSSCAMVDDFEYAETVINEGRSLATTAEARQNIGRLHSEVLIKQADYIVDETSKEKFDLRLAAISRAVQSNPRSVAGYKRLMSYVSTENDSPERELWLRRSVIGSRTPGISHIILGLRALNRGEISEGQRHWLIASKQTPSAHSVINLLIEYAHTKEPERFTNLKDIVSVAIENFPRQPIFYFTRGRMYLSDKNFEQAIDDFEVAVKKLPNLLNLRQALVEAYTGVGNTENAAVHQAECDRLSAELEAQRLARIEASAAG